MYGSSMLAIPAVLIFYLTITVLFLLPLEEAFQKCPNKDILLWDANIRLITGIDILQYFHIDQYWQGILLFLDSPTWPPLRTLLSILTIIVTGKPDPLQEIRWNLFFFLMTVTGIYVATLFVFWKEFLKSHYHKAIILLSSGISISFLFLLRQLPEYIYSAMLEIQGMVFFSLFSFLLIFLYHEENRKYLESLRIKILFFLLGAFLYLTKYPYGVLVIFSFFFVEIIRDFGAFRKETARFLSSYRNYRIIFLILPLAGIILILLYPHYRWEMIPQKTLKNFLYLSILLPFLELQIFLLRKKVSFYNRRIVFFYKFFILPFSIVILSHPDRFHSLLGAQADTIDRGRNFFLSIFQDYFLNPVSFSLLVFLSLLFVSIRHRFRLKELLSHPVISGLIFVWSQLIVLEFLTTNHQSRYIFHILPVMFLLHALLFLDDGEKNRIFGLLFLSFLFVFNVRDAFSHVYSDGKHVCFAQYDTKLFQPVRVIPAVIEENTRGVIFNEFHYYKKYSMHLENPYLFIPTDIDVFLRYKIYPRGFVTNYSPYREIYPFQNYWIYITVSCQNELLSSPFWNLKETYEVISQETNHILHYDEFLCVKVYYTVFNKRKSE